MTNINFDATAIDVLNESPVTKDDIAAMAKDASGDYLEIPAQFASWVFTVSILGDVVNVSARLDVGGK